MKALAVFHNYGTHILAPFLKRGFRHVYVVLQSDDYWIRVDGMNGIPIAEVITGADYDLATFYRAEGFAVIEMDVGNEPPLGPIVLANCVGFTKTLLGIRKLFVVTPYGLYRHLRNVAWLH